MEKNSVFDRYVSGFTFLLGLLVIVYSMLLPKPIFAGQMGPGIFPTGIGALIVIVSVVLFRESGEKSRTEASEQPTSDQQVTTEKLFNRHLLFVIGALIIYILLFQILGFVISSMALILALGLLLGARKWIPLTLISVLFPTALFLLFGVLGVELPAGIMHF